MSLRDYEISREINGTADWGEDFYALVMVLMRNADTTNAAKLRNAWPEVWDEYEERYNAPGGLLVGESRQGVGRHAGAPRRRPLLRLGRRGPSASESRLMARHFTAAVASGQYGRPEEASERVSLDGERFSSSATLRGEYIGLAPDLLLEHALDALHEREKLIADLLQHVPRKHEDKIKALSSPLHEARQAIAAAHYLIENARLALAPAKDGQQ